MPPPPPRYADGEGMTSAHPSVLHPAPAGTRSRQTTTVDNPTDLHDGQAAAGPTRPQGPESSENAP
jgi:hypothetical protein